MRRPNFTEGDGFWGCMSKAGFYCQAVRPSLSRTCCLYTGQEEDVVTWSWQGRFDLKQGTQKGGEDLEQLSDGWLIVVEVELDEENGVVEKSGVIAWDEELVEGDVVVEEIEAVEGDVVVEKIEVVEGDAVVEVNVVGEESKVVEG